MRTLAVVAGSALLVGATVVAGSGVLLQPPDGAPDRPRPPSLAELPPPQDGPVGGVPVAWAAVDPRQALVGQQAAQLTAVRELGPFYASVRPISSGLGRVRFPSGVPLPPASAVPTFLTGTRLAWVFLYAGPAAPVLGASRPLVVTRVGDVATRTFVMVDALTGDTLASGTG